jgi:fatty-acyl-CoA synthase
VGIWSPNNAEWVVTQFATAKLGLILVTINPAYRPQELEYALRKVGCAALVTASAFKTSDYIGMLRQIAPEIATGAPGRLNLQKLPDLRAIIQIGETTTSGLLSFEEVCRSGSNLPPPRVKLRFDDPINIQFTSGTLGVLEAIEAERCTALHGVPTMFISILEHPAPVSICRRYAPAPWPARPARSRSCAA